MITITITTDNEEDKQAIIAALEAAHDMGEIERLEVRVGYST